MSTLEELRAWLESMRARTCRSFALQGSVPAGWHLLQSDGEFGFLDVELPTSAEEHAQLIERMRGTMRELDVRACLFVAERELADGRPVVFLQHEAIDARGRRHRAVELLRVVANAGARSVDDATPVGSVIEADRVLLQNGLFPDLLPTPPSPLRIQ